MDCPAGKGSLAGSDNATEDCTVVCNFTAPGGKNCVTGALATPISCIQGYVLNSGACAACTVSNCGVCTFADKADDCTTCKSGFKLTA